MALVATLRSAVCLLGRYPALAGVDLDVDAGDVVLVSGANGAGKTTLLRLMAGLVPLRAGSATVLGHDLAVDRLSVRDRLAFVGHETRCYDDLTVAENLTFATKASGHAPADPALLESLDLTRLAHVTHRSLSAGQRRRLALAIGLARDPELLLLDEPHAGLDTVGREVIDAVLHNAARQGRTIVLTSHELDRARALASREIELVTGRAIGGRIEASPPMPQPPTRPSEQAATDEPTVDEVARTPGEGPS